MKQGMLSLFLSLFALNAFTADEDSWIESLRQWDYYLGAGLGWGNHERFNVENSVETFQFGTAGFTTTITQSISGDFEPDAKAWRVVGGAWFHEHFGVEFGYLDLGKTTINQSTETTTETQPMFGSPLVFLAPPPGTVSTQSEFASSLEVYRYLDVGEGATSDYRKC